MILKVAKYVITKRIESNKPITNLDLQKLLKQIQDEIPNLFFDEYQKMNNIYCYPNVYYYFAGYGVMPITYKYNIVLSTKTKIKIDEIIDNFVGFTEKILKEDL